MVTNLLLATLIASPLDAGLPPPLGLLVLDLDLDLWAGARAALEAGAAALPLEAASCTRTHGGGWAGRRRPAHLVDGVHATSFGAKAGAETAWPSRQEIMCLCLGVVFRSRKWWGFIKFAVEAGRGKAPSRGARLACAEEPVR